jgi:hypothetical protein
MNITLYILLITSNQLLYGIIPIKYAYVMTIQNEVVGKSTLKIYKFTSIIYLTNASNNIRLIIILS